MGNFTELANHISKMCPNVIDKVKKKRKENRVSFENLFIKKFKKSYGDK